MLIPLKWQAFAQLPPPRSRIRQIVSELGQSELRLPPVAIEILSEICGRFLRTAQRRALAPLLHEHLTDARLRWGDYGSLSQADVLGAIVGLAVFLLDTPGNWMLLRIPEGSDSTPDVFALQQGGAPWVIELKGTAPLST